MGSRIQKIATVMFALAFVAILAIMNSSILSLGSNSNKKLNSTLSTTDNYELSSFDETTVTGDTVISAIGNCKTLSSSTKLKITVYTNANSSGEEYGYTDEDDDDFTEYSITDPRDDDFINPSAEFEASLVTNDNDIVTEIEFEQK